MRPERVSEIAASLLSPKGRRLVEPGARRLACARAYPGSTGEEIAHAVALAEETFGAAAAQSRHAVRHVNAPQIARFAH